MVPLYAIVIGAFAAVFIGMLIGAIVRFVQEKFHAETIVLAIVALPMQFVITVFFPVTSAFRVFFAEHFRKMFILTRIMWSIVALVVSTVYVIGRFHEMTEASFWSPLSDVNTLFEKVKAASSLKTFHLFRAGVRRSMDSSYAQVNQRVEVWAFAR